MAYPRSRRSLSIPAESPSRGKDTERNPKRHRLLPAAVPMLLAFCMFGFLFLWRPDVVYAQDRVVITRVREYFPPSDSLPELEIYYPQISFGGNPNRLQAANTLMREYAIEEYCAFRQDALSGRREPPADGRLSDYRITRNSGGFFSVVFTANSSSLANDPPSSPHGFTIRLADQKICRLADLFVSDTNYTSLLDQEISRIFGSPFEGVCHDSPFFLTDSDIVILPGGKGENKLSEPVRVSLTAPAVSRKLAAGLTEGHTDKASLQEDEQREIPGPQDSQQAAPEDTTSETS